MTQKDIKRRMSDRHESWLATMFGGSIAPGSGNQPANQGDVRMSRFEHGYAVCFDKECND
jgi:hypothetical protein